MGRALTTWQRLFWREARESWAPLLVAAIAPAVLFTAAGSLPYRSVLRSLFVLVGAMGTQLTVILWAVTKADSRRHGGDMAGAHLPVRHVEEWAASFVAPLLVTAIVGAWYGIWAGIAVVHWDMGAWSGLFLLAGALDLASAFAVCYFISKVVSKWVSILYGVAHWAGGTLIGVFDLALLHDVQTYAFIACAVVGAVAGSLIFAVTAGRRSLPFRQGVSLAALVVIMFAPLIAGVDVSFLRPEATSSRLLYPGYWSNGIELQIGGKISPEAKQAVMHLDDYRNDTSLNRTFDVPAVALGALPDGRIYIAQQLGESDSVRILEWNDRLNTVTDIATAQTGRHSLASIDWLHSSVDPSGRYILFSAQARIGAGLDIWIADLRAHRSRLLLQGVFLITFVLHDAHWQRDRVVLSGRDIAFLDLTNMKMSRVSVPAGGGW